MDSLEVYLFRLQFRQWTVGAVDLLVESAGVAQVVSGAITPPERC